MKKHSILLVDDDEELLSETSQALCSSGYDVITAATGKRAKEIFENFSPEIALIDKRLPDIDGQVLIGELKKISTNTDFIIMTAYGSLESSVKGFRDGIADYIIKPAGIDIITKRIENVIAINEKKEKEKNIEHEWGLVQAKKYETLFESAKDAIFIADAETGILVDCNKAACILTEYNKNEIVGKPQAFLYSQAKEISKNYLENIPAINEFVVQTKTGEAIPVQISASVIRLDQKNYIQGIFRDLRESKKAQEETKRQNKFLNDIFESITNPLYVIDINTYQIKMANSASNTKKSDLNQPCYAVLHKFNTPCFNKGYECLIEEVKKRKKPAVLEHIHCGRNEKVRNFELHGYPIFNNENKIVQLIEYAIDVTEKRFMENELKQHARKLEETVNVRTNELKSAFERLEKANKKLLELDALKSEFVSNVAHEIINPLTVIKAGISNINDGIAGEISDNAKKILYISGNEVDRLTRFTKNMLDLSKIEAGKMPINPSKVNIKDLINNIVQYFENETKNKNVKLLVEIKSAHDYISADQDMMKEILINLISNAIKNSPSGKTIKLNVFDFENNLRIEIKDEGQGIPINFQKKIFDKYFRIFQERTEGTGLGLSIVQKIVELHKGKIWVESIEGNGATFIVLLPL